MLPPAAPPVKRLPENSPGEEEDKHEDKSLKVEEEAGDESSGTESKPSRPGTDAGDMLETAPRSATPPPLAPPDTPPEARQVRFQTDMAGAAPPPPTVQEHAITSAANAAAAKELPIPPTVEAHKHAVSMVIEELKSKPEAREDVWALEKALNWGVGPLANLGHTLLEFVTTHDECFVMETNESDELSNVTLILGLHAQPSAAAAESSSRTLSTALPPGNADNAAGHSASATTEDVPAPAPAPAAPAPAPA